MEQARSSFEGHRAFDSARLYACASTASRRRSLLVVLGVRQDGQKVLLAVRNMGEGSEAASAETASMLFWGLFASGQITLRKVDGRRSLDRQRAQPIDLAA